MKIKEYEEIMLKYSFALDILETNLRIILKEYEYKNKVSIVDHVKMRLKSYDSTINKLEKKGYSINHENIEKHIHDLAGIRIVCPFLTDVYKVLNIIKESDFLKIKEEKDYIKNPKDTGYISYHLKVEVPINLNEGTELVEAEIQIRTMAMDFWASLDHRLQYKLPEEIPTSIREEIYKCSVDIKNVDEKMMSLKEKIDNYINS